MSAWFQLLLSVLGLAKWIFKYMSKHKKTNKECIVKVKNIKKDLKNAIKNKDTSKIENAFSNLNLDK